MSNDKKQLPVIESGAPTNTDDIDAGLKRQIEAQAIAAANRGQAPMVNRMSAPVIDTSEIAVEEEQPMGIDEIHARSQAGSFSQDFEQVTGGNATKEALALEKFMNEMVIITVAEDTDEEALPIISVMVNGTMQPIVRGYPTPVRRKYVEALARAKETKYKQQQMDASDPSSLAMIPRTGLAYNFTVERDDNPNGRAWLRDILKQKA